ncbi:biotin/lipoyl-binding protein [Pseudonocardia sp.]|uniref:efflux RND transporter periplasmic adaptor subunit n=1 Tax=Pseudonocardia sp. TaxID=60912 RepID=UPI0026090C76|nr:biotin/lipoyl-binding protein [Pseudonocardia sp.]
MRNMRRAAVVAAVLVTTAACSGAPAPPPVVRVDRGLVATSVSASGTLVSVREQNLGFAEGGELAEVFVQVGDRVSAGQVLARLDDAAREGALERSEAQLAQAQAQLDKITGGNQVDAAAATLEQARAILDATEDQVEATAGSNASATERARAQLDFDRSALARAQETLHEDRKACDTASATAQPSLLDAAPAPDADAEDPACGRIAADETAVQQAEGAVLASETAVASAEQREQVDAAAGRLSVENARQSVVTAQNNLEQAGSDRPADTAAQEAAVRDAQVGVALARDDLDAAALRAPVAGVVSAINGAVGEFVGPASGTTAQAPGSSARLPGTTDAAGTGGASTGGAAFLVLNDVDSFQLVVPFEESDAARLQVDQAVDVTVDALPDLTLPGTVLAVAPSGDDASGIVSFSATVLLTGSDPRLRDGQTAEASVRVQAVDNVLRVPSSTVRTQDGRRVVDAPRPDGGDPVVLPFEPGAVGDEYLEVRSGLREGQEVLVPQGQVASAPGGPRQN